MLSSEFITEEIALIEEILNEEFIFKGAIGDGMTYGVSSHVPQRAAERDIDMVEIHRMIRKLPYIKRQLTQMQHFPQFYIRDDQKNIELGCRFTSFGSPVVQLLYINTVVNSDHVRKSSTPTILLPSL
jgi:hypothetical protein